MTYTRKNKGVCSLSTEVTLTDDGVIESVTVVGGCNGNLKGISALLTGLRAEDAIRRLKGLTCGSKHTSCPTRSRWRWKKRWQNETIHKIPEHQKHGRAPVFFSAIARQSRKNGRAARDGPRLTLKSAGHRVPGRAKKNTGPAARVFSVRLRHTSPVKERSDG
jgi:uncharacterized protein (TIGR03905 family)